MRHQLPVHAGRFRHGNPSFRWTFYPGTRIAVSLPGIAVSGPSEFSHAACSGRGIGRTGRPQIVDDAESVVFAGNRLWSGFDPANGDSLSAAGRDGASHGLYERAANIA